MEEIRIDKYLWAIRVYKTRTDATEACKGGKVKVGTVNAKPSRAVAPGEVITVRKGVATFTYRVIQLVDHRLGAKLVPDYAENLTPEEELNKLKAPVETFFVTRDRGTGRPTKKDRRALEQIWDAIDFSEE